MQGKVLSKSQNGKLVQLGTDIRSGKWYYFDAVRDSMDKIVVGDDITYAFVQKGNYLNLTFVGKGTVEIPVEFTTESPVTAPVVQVQAKPVSAPVAKEPYAPYVPQTKNWDKNTASIERQVAFKGAVEIAVKMLEKDANIDVGAIVKEFTEKFIVTIRG